MILNQIETMAKYLSLYTYTEAAYKFSIKFKTSLLYAIKIRTKIVEVSIPEYDMDGNVITN